MVEDVEEGANGTLEHDLPTSSQTADNGEAQKSTKSSRMTRRPDTQPGDNFGVGDIRKAAAFANSIGGLDKAIAVLQILKVAKEVL